MRKKNREITFGGVYFVDAIASSVGIILTILFLIIGKGLNKNTPAKLSQMMEENIIKGNMPIEKGYFTIGAEGIGEVKGLDIYNQCYCLYENPKYNLKCPLFKVFNDRIEMVWTGKIVLKNQLVSHKEEIVRYVDQCRVPKSQFHMLYYLIYENGMYHELNDFNNNVLKMNWVKKWVTSGTLPVIEKNTNGTITSLDAIPPKEERTDSITEKSEKLPPADSMMNLHVKVLEKTKNKIADMNSDKIGKASNEQKFAAFQNELNIFGMPDSVKKYFSEAKRSAEKETIPGRSQSNREKNENNASLRNYKPNKTERDGQQQEAEMGRGEEIKKKNENRKRDRYPDVDSLIRDHYEFINNMKKKMDRAIKQDKSGKIDSIKAAVYKEEMMSSKMAQKILEISEDNFSNNKDERDGENAREKGKERHFKDDDGRKRGKSTKDEKGDSSIKNNRSKNEYTGQGWKEMKSTDDKGGQSDQYGKNKNEMTKMDKPPEVDPNDQEEGSVEQELHDSDSQYNVSMEQESIQESTKRPEIIFDEPIRTGKEYDPLTKQILPIPETNEYTEKYQYILKLNTSVDTVIVRNVDKRGFISLNNDTALHFIIKVHSKPLPYAESIVLVCKKGFEIAIDTMNFAKYDIPRMALSWIPVKIRNAKRVEYFKNTEVFIYGMTDMNMILLTQEENAIVVSDLKFPKAPNEPSFLWVRMALIGIILLILMMLLILYKAKGL